MNNLDIMNPNNTPPALVWNAEAEDKVIDIAKHAMLVDTSFAVIGNTKKDRSLQDKLLEDSGAEDDAINVTKVLFDKTHLARVRAIRSKARNYIRDYTLPWGKSGERLLPATMFNDFSQRIEALKTEWDSAVAQVIENYPAMIDSSRERLGELFKSTDYPEIEELEDIFNFSVLYLPVPTANDFRVGLIGQASMDAIKGSIDGIIDRKVSEANSEIFRRMLEAVTHLTDRLNTDKGVFRNSSVEKINEIADLAESMNLTKNADITELSENLRDLAKIEPVTLREDQEKRKETIETATAIADKLKGVM